MADAINEGLDNLDSILDDTADDSFDQKPSEHTIDELERAAEQMSSFHQPKNISRSASTATKSRLPGSSFNYSSSSSIFKSVSNMFNVGNSFKGSSGSIYESSKPPSTRRFSTNAESFRRSRPSAVDRRRSLNLEAAIRRGDQQIVPQANIKAEGGEKARRSLNNQFEADNSTGTFFNQSVSLLAYQSISLIA